MMAMTRQRRVLPGFGITLGFTLLYLSLIVLIPLSTVLLKTATLSWSEFWATVTSARTLAAYRLSLETAWIAAAVNVIAAFDKTFFIDLVDTVDCSPLMATSANV